DPVAICAPFGCAEETYDLRVYDLSPLPDGGVAAAISLYDATLGFEGYFVVSFDADGQVQWAEEFTDPVTYAVGFSAAHVLGLADGRIVLAQNFGPAPGTSVYDQAGLLVAIYDGSGEREVLEGMRITEVENAGQGIPATATPYV